MRVTPLVVGAVLFGGCSFDLVLPPDPVRGTVKGTLDTSSASPAVSPEGHTVKLTSVSGGSVTQMTGAGGSFQFSDLPVGGWILEVRVAGFAPEVVTGIQVASGKETDVGAVKLMWLGGGESAATVAGKLATADNADPTGGEVAFLLQPSNMQVAIASVGKSGEFVERVPPGTYRLRGSHPLYTTALTPELTFTQGQSADVGGALVLGLNPAVLSGRVQVERDGLDPAPGQGVLVTVDPGGMTTTSAADGTFGLSGLSGGRKTVRFQLQNHHDAVETHEVTLTPGQTSTLPTVQLFLDRGDLVGRVELADRQTALGVDVAVTGTTYAASVSPDAVEPWKGSFRLRGLPVATGYEVVAVKPGYSRAVRGGQAVTKNAPTDVGALTLTALQGDFVIDDGDTQNTAGFTRTTAVTLKLQSFATMGAAQFRASENPMFPDAGFVAFSGADQAFSLSSAEGTHVVYAQYKDSAGTDSPVFTAKVVLDSVAPAMPSTLLNGGAAFTSNGAAVDVRASATEDVSPGVDAVSGLREMRVAESATVDANGNLPVAPRPYQRDFSQPRSATMDGSFTLCVQLFDHAGNKTAPACDAVMVDTAAPTGTLTLRRGALATANGFTNTERVVVDLAAAAEPNGGALKVRLANSMAALPNAVFQPVTPTAVLVWDLDPSGADGARQVFWELQDSAGNVTTGLPAQLTLDRTPPVPAALTVAGGPLTRSASLTVNVGATDTLSMLSSSQGVTLSEDATFTSPSTVGPRDIPAGGTLPFTLSAGDGPKLLYARYRDGAGNDAFTSLRIDLDTTPPSATFELEGRLRDNTLSSTLSAFPDVFAVVTSFGATGFVLGTSTLTTCPASGYTALPSDGRLMVTLSGTPGPQQVRLCLTDAAGNTLGPLTRSMTLDAAAPAACSFTVAGQRADGSPAPAGQTAKSVVTVSTSGCNETPTEWVVSQSPVTCTSAGLPWVPFAPGSALSLVGGDGSYTVQGCVRDAARNFAAPMSATITLDATAPTGTSLTLDNGAAFSNLAQYQAAGNTFRASAAGTATGATRWALSLTPTFGALQAFPATSPATFTFPATGPQRLYAVFSDELGNTSAVVFDDITFDIVAPSVSGTTLSLVTSAPDPAFVASDSVSVRINPQPPPDATKSFLVQVPTTTACTAGSVFTGAVPRPVTSDLAFVASGGDGQKRVCVAFADDAGNVSAPLTLDFTVDRTPPTAPEISTANALTRLTDNAVFNVALARPVTETNFLRYELNGGKLTLWSAGSTVQATTSFAFNVVSSSMVAQTTNLLQLRAVDRAGNVGQASAVTVVTDIQLPAAPVTDAVGVSNASGSAAVYWAPSTSTDLSHYLVDYGPSPGQYNGTQAIEGASPITMPAASTFATLHGLIDGTPTFVRLRPVDLAGNVGAGSTEVMLQPSVISPSLIAQVSLPASAGGVGRVVVQEDIAYALGPTQACFSGVTALGLTALDLGRLKSAPQAGVLEQPLPTVPLLWSVSIPAALANSPCGSLAYDVLVDGPWIFVAVNSSIYVYRSLSRSSAPTLRSTIAVGSTVRTLAQKGHTLFANGGGRIAAFDLRELYDESAMTAPDNDLLGATTAGIGAAIDTSGIVVTRNRLLQVPLNANVSEPYFDIRDATDGLGSTWDDMDFVASVTTPNLHQATHAPKASGNYVYGFSEGNLLVRSVHPLWTSATAVVGATTIPLLAGSGSGDVGVWGRDIVAVAKLGATMVGVDVTTASAPAISSLYQLGSLHPPLTMATYGNYVLIGTSSGRLQFYEYATPRGLRLSVSRPEGSIYEVSGGFAFGANGSVVDLQAGVDPLELVSQASSSNPYSCSMDLALFDDQLVRAPGTTNQLMVIDTSLATDRQPMSILTLSPLAPADGYTVTFPSVSRFLALEKWGNYLVALEYRPTGFFVEVFRATALRDTSSATQLSAADSVGAIQVSALTPMVPGGSLVLSQGRAFVTIAEDFGVAMTAAPTLFAVDLRNVVDDDASTTGLVSRGSLPVVSARGFAVAGTHAYVATRADRLEVWDVSGALTDTMTDQLAGTMPVGSVTLATRPQVVTAFGSYAYVSNDGNGAAAKTWVVDVSAPATPRVASVAPFALGSLSCGASPRGSLNVTGTKLWVGAHGRLHVLDLE